MKRYFVVLRICVKGTYPEPKRRERRRSLVRECRTLDFREKGQSSNPLLRNMFSVGGNALGFATNELCPAATGDFCRTKKR